METLTELHLENTAVCEGAFIYGAAFVIMPLIVCFLIDIPMAIMETVRQKWRIHECYMRYEHGFDTLCRYHTCPHASKCRYHRPRRTLREWWNDRKKKKPLYAKWCKGSMTGSEPVDPSSNLGFATKKKKKP